MFNLANQSGIEVSNELWNAKSNLSHLMREEEERQKKLESERKKESLEREKEVWDREWYAVARQENDKPKNKELIDATLFLVNGNSTVYYDDMPIESKKDIRVKNCQFEFPSGNYIDFRKVYWSRGTIQRRTRLNPFTNAWETFYESNIPCDKCRKLYVISWDFQLLSELEHLRTFPTPEARTLDEMAVGDENALVYYTHVEEDRIRKALSTIQRICPGIRQKKRY